MQNRIRTTMYFRGIIPSLRSLYPRECVLEHTLGHLVAVAAAGLVALLGPDEDGRCGDWRRPPVDEPLRAQGVPAAARADGPKLDHLISLGIGPNGSPLKSMSRPAAITSYPASASRLQTSIIPLSKNCTSSMATTLVVSSTFPRSSSLVETASASCGTPLWDRISVISERVSMVCLKTCALRWA